MKKLEFNKARVIETADDITFSIQATKTRITDATGTHDGCAEIVLLIEDEENHKEIATILSTDNTDKLINELCILSKQVKEYNNTL